VAALERIGQYLKRTLKEGLTFSPTDSLEIDCFLGVDFAGLWHHDDNQDPWCVNSRTGLLFVLQTLLWSGQASYRETL